MSETSKLKHAAEKETNLADSLIEEAREKISDITDEARARGEKLVKTAKNKANDLWEDVEDESISAWKDAQTLVKKHPGPAIGCAIVLGGLLYAIFSRDRD